jgi:elongation factor Ts
MAEIAASMVMELRGRTGLGMMECKKALAEAGGDMAKAEELLRIKSGAKASKAADRLAAEGVIGVHVAPDAKLAALVEVNCETDFVAKNEEFRAFATEIARVVARDNPSDVVKLAACKLASGDSVEGRRVALVQKIGENLSIRRFARRSAAGQIASYVHGTRIGVLVDFTGGDAALGKDLAMHVAASAAPGAVRAICVSRDQVPKEAVDQERAIFMAQAAESGKPAAIVAKMVEGRINKYLAEVTLLGQPFVKDPEHTVEQYLKSKDAKVHAFTLFVVGEGLDKKKDDFAAEVAAMAKV